MDHAQHARRTAREQGRRRVGAATGWILTGATVLAAVFGAVLTEPAVAAAPRPAGPVGSPDTATSPATSAPDTSGSPSLSPDQSGTVSGYSDPGLQPPGQPPSYSSGGSRHHVLSGGS